MLKIKQGNLIVLKKPDSGNSNGSSNQTSAGTPLSVKPLDSSNANKYISTIRITSDGNTGPQLRDVNNNNMLREQRRYKHKSMFLETAFTNEMAGTANGSNASQKSTMSVKEAAAGTMPMRSNTPASFMDVTCYAEQRTRTEPAHSIEPVTCASTAASGVTNNTNKTSIYVEPSRTPVPFSTSLNSGSISKPTTYRIQDLLFRFITFHFSSLSFLLL